MTTEPADASTPERLMPDATFGINPTLGDLRVTGGHILRTAISGRIADAQRWQQQGLAGTQRHVRQAASALTDEFFLHVVRALNSKAAQREIDRVVTETYDGLDLYRSQGWLDPAKLHVTPEPLKAERTPLVVNGHRWQRLVGEQTWSPPTGSPGAERWLGYPGRQPLVHLRMHREPRPWLVMVHGAYMGDLKMDARILNTEFLFHRLGLNLALPTLPLHGSRKVRGGLSRTLPSLDTMDNVHGLTQAVHEVRSLLAWIRREQPGQRLGIYGVSLGGYVTSLTAGLEGPLDCVIAGVPAVDFQSLFLSQTPSNVRATAWFQAFHEANVALNEPLSPLAMTPATPVSARYIYAARGDRVLPPDSQSLRLWEHWGRPTSYWFDGAHVLQVRNKAVRKFVGRAAARSLEVRPA